MAHNRGMKISQGDLVPLGSAGWRVHSQREELLYYSVKIVGDICREVRCLPCRDCKICRHMIKCSCADYTSNDNICKHIHACISRNPHAVAPRRVDIEKELKEMLKSFVTVTPDYREISTAKADTIVMAIKTETDPNRLVDISAAYDAAGAREKRRGPANKIMTPQRVSPKQAKRERFGLKRRNNMYSYEI